MKARNKKQSYRVAIVGCGRIAGGYDMPRSRSRGKIRTHIKAYLSNRRFQVVAASDSNAKKLKSFCTHWKIPNAYKNLESMLVAEKPDVVSICVPTSAHRKILETIARHPVQLVFAEKPFTASCRDAESVLKKLKARRISVAVNYLRRWCPNHQKLKKIIESGRLGRLRSFDAIYSGDLENIGSHLIDLINYLAGRIVSVRGKLNGRAGELRLSSGVTGFIEHTPRDQFALELLFDRGLIQITNYGYAGECIVWKGKGMRTKAYVVYRFGDPSHGIDSAMGHAVRNIASHLSGGAALLSGVPNALATLRVIEALRKSSKTGKTIATPSVA